MKKVAVLLILLVIVAGVTYVGMKHYPAYRDMRLILNSPQVQVIPQSFAPSSENKTYGYTTRHFYEDFSYLVPSNTVPEERPHSVIHKVQLSDSKEITFLQKDDEVAILSKFLEDEKDFEGLTPFEIERHILYATPLKTDSNRDSRRTNMKIMTVKFGLITREPVYEFKVNYVKGFQFGKLDSESMSARVDFYVNEIPHSLISRGLTQAELNYLLLSIRPR